MAENNRYGDQTESPPELILFDGFCYLCNRSVDFIIKRDRKKLFRYVALQSEAGVYLKRRLNLDSTADSVILWKEGKLYYRSDAALRIALRLRFPWPMTGIFLIIPRFIRDHIYRLVADNRYRWFGKREVCRYPTREEIHLFPSRDDLELQISRFIEPEHFG